MSTGGGNHLGIDVGTQGIRAVLVDPSGTVLARGEQPLRTEGVGGVREQDPSGWWRSVVEVIASLGPARATARSLAVSCTSGTVCVLDGNGDPVMPALIYSDRRADTRFGVDATWASAKIRWLVAEMPEVVGRAALVTSPGGFLTGRFLGTSAPVDHTQALKFGFDPTSEGWQDVPLVDSQLPDVVPMGTVVGTVHAQVVAATGLDPGTEVVVGVTDGVAAHLACQPAPGRWSTVLGSTVVWKTTSGRRISSAEAGVYSHRGPGGWWFPGAASNAGMRVLSTWATALDLDQLAATATFSPAAPAAYPSTARGERFPFVDPEFTPWGIGDASDDVRYAAEVCGAAFVERWGCEELVAQGCAPPSAVATTGGASRAQRVTQLRADVMQVPFDVPAEPSSAFGAAVVAAGPAFGGIGPASLEMVQWAASVEPDARLADEWTGAYERFRVRCGHPRRSTVDDAR